MAEKAKIYEAISNVMRDVGVVGKDSTNDFDHYKFRGIDAVMNALNPAMVKNKVFVTPTILDASREERVGKNGTAMMYSVLTVKYTFYTDDGSSVECVVIGEAMDRSDKSTNKAMSAAFKYACFQTFCIPTEEMQDSEIESLEIGEKTDKQKNKEMIQSVDQRYLVSADGKMTKEQYELLLAEIERTQTPLEKITSYAKTEDLKAIPSKTCVAILIGMQKKPTAEKR